MACNCISEKGFKEMEKELTINSESQSSSG